MIFAIKIPSKARDSNGKDHVGEGINLHIAALCLLMSPICVVAEAALHMHIFIRNNFCLFLIIDIRTVHSSLLGGM